MCRIYMLKMVILMKEVKELMEEVKEDLNKWIDSP